MKRMKNISIIVPVYNASRTLEFTVGSILSPSFFGNCELILVDDGSTDGSAEICDSFAALDDSIRVIHQKNGGVSRARNAGIAAASGEYLMFVDSDDLLPADALGTFLDALRSAGAYEGKGTEEALDVRSEDGQSADIYIGGCTFAGPGGNPRQTLLPDCGRIYREDELHEFWDTDYNGRKSFIRPVWGKLFRRALVEETSLRFVPGLNYGEDVLFLFEYLLRCRTVATVPHSVYTYREGNAGLSADRCSDAHLMQLMLLLHPYSEMVLQMQARWPQSICVAGIYHEDVIGRIVCRILTVFATRRTPLCNHDNISRLYSYMAKDARLNAVGGAFSFRKGQIINMLLYQLASPSFAAHFYSLSSRFCELFAIRPKSY